MIKLYMLVWLIVGYECCCAQYPGYELLRLQESFRQNFEKTTSATESIQSDFSQEKSMTMLSEKIYSTGKFWFRKTDKLRMEYLKPYPYLMILNAGNIFIKDASQKENKISASSNKMFQQVNRILLDCVSGKFLKNADFETGIYESPNSFMVELKPLLKSMKSLYKNINIVIDKKDYTVKSIEMLEISGDVTIIRFQNKVINAQIPDSVFNIP
jgi:outer membrane lipoprotein-sorting protein